MRKTIIFLSILLVLLVVAVVTFFYPAIWWDISYLGKEAALALQFLGPQEDNQLKELPVCSDCNVVLLSLDTQRADRLGCYGYKRNTSPHIDKFAAESIVFKQAFANAYNTLPSHMSIFTSLYPLTHRVNTVRQERPLSEDFLILPQLLKQKGYQTIWSGPLHDPHLDFQKGFGRGIDKFYRPLFTKVEGFNEELFSDIFKSIDGKFYLFLHSYINNAPYFYPAEFNTVFSNPHYDGDMPSDEDALLAEYFPRMKKDYLADPENFLKGMESVDYPLRKKLIKEIELGNATTFKNVILEYLGSSVLHIPHDYQFTYFFYGTFSENINAEDIVELSNRYDNGVYYADYLFNSLAEALKERGLLDNTIVVVTADHGEELYEHKGFDHDNFYEHTIHVPLIIRIPGIEKKIEVDKLAQSIDIVPMILAILKIGKPDYIQGKDLLSAENKNNFVFGFCFGDMYVRSEKWKYIISGKYREELYYLPLDPQEKCNLAESGSIIAKRYKNKFKDILIEWEMGQF